MHISEVNAGVCLSLPAGAFQELDCKRHVAGANAMRAVAVHDAERKLCVRMILAISEPVQRLDILRVCHAHPVKPLALHTALRNLTCACVFLGQGFVACYAAEVSAAVGQRVSRRVSLKSAASAGEAKVSHAQGGESITKGQGKTAGP